MPSASRSCDAVAQGGAQAIVEHHLRPRRGEPVDHGLREGLAGLALGHEHDAGLGAQLAGGERHRAGELLGDGVGALGQRALGDHDRVDAAHLGVDRDRLRAARGALVQRPAGRQRAGEADGGDRGRVHERLAHVVAGALHEREGAVGQAGVGARGATRQAATASLVPGWDGWPLATTGQPAASADAVSPPATPKASGKLLAPNTATGPIGTSMRRTSGRGIGCASGSAVSIIAST